MFNNLKAEMVRQNVGKKEMAEKLNITVSTLNRKLNGRTEFYMDELIKICNMLTNIYTRKGIIQGKLSLEYLFAEF